MLKPRLSRWLLLIFGLVLAAGAVLAGVTFFERPLALPVIDAVTVSRETGGDGRLILSGRGLHGGLQPLLIPDQRDLSFLDAPFSLDAELFQMATDGRLAVASMRDQRFIALDVTAGRQPAVLGMTRLSPPVPFLGVYLVNVVALVGSRAVVGMGDAGLILVDVADPTTPRQIDHLEFDGHYFDMESARGKVYATNQANGLQVITTEGDRLRSRPVAGSSNAWRVAINGGRLVTASQKGELALYEFDSRGWPQPVGRVNLSRAVRDLTLLPDALYVCTGDGQLLELALGGWPRLTLSGRIGLPGQPLRLECEEGSPRLFCSLVGSGVGIIDVGRRGAPRLAGSIVVPKVPIALKISAGSLFLSGNNGLRIFPAKMLADVPPLPDLVYPSTGSPGAVHLFPWRGAVYAYDQHVLVRLSDQGAVVPQPGTERREEAPILALPEHAGIRLYPVRDGMPGREVIGRIPISDPSAEIVGDHVDRVLDTAWHAGRLFVLSPTRVRIYDYDPAGTLVLAGEHRFQEEPKIMDWLEPGLLVMAVFPLGVQLVDVRNPATPRLIGEYSLPKHLQSVGKITDLLVDGQRLFISRGRLGVEMLDLTNPAKPRSLQLIGTPGNAGKLSLQDGLLSVTDRNEGVFMIDVRGELGVPVGSYRLPIVAHEILSYRDNVYLTNAAGGILRLPAPLWLAPADTGSDGGMELTVPAKVPPGNYALLLYNGAGATRFPVTLQ